jgi:hypothetical protein
VVLSVTEVTVNMIDTAEAALFDWTYRREPTGMPSR